MKRIIMLLLCVMMLLVPLSASAEESYTPENEITAETESVPPTEVAEDDWSTITGAVKEWIEPNLEEISVVVTLIGYGILLFTKLGNILKSMGTMNNNNITISKKNADFMEQAVDSINNASGAVTGYDARIVALLSAFQQTAEDKKRLEAELLEMKSYLIASSKSNLEFSNELAELIALANIPNYKKEELGARHVAAKDAIISFEEKAANDVANLLAPKTEVMENDGETKEN